MNTALYLEAGIIQEGKLTSCTFRVPGVPQGLNPPEKLGKLRQTIDRMLKQEGQCQILLWSVVPFVTNIQLHMTSCSILIWKQQRFQMYKMKSDCIYAYITCEEFEALPICHQVFS